jgi:TRAP transporter TAXI family solute receptor
VLALSACISGPNADALQSDLNERLAQALPEGTIMLAAFERRGSQADTGAPSGETRRIVYFDAGMKLARDYDFGAWDSPGVAGLVSALGTGPKGIVGIGSQGNKAGDLILAHGSALYRRDGDRWTPVVSGGVPTAAAPTYATNAPATGPGAMLEAMRKVVESIPKDAAPAQRVVIEQELAAANVAIRARLARATEGYPIAAGPEHGQYLRFAQALSDVKGARMVALVTRGGEENLRLLRAGKVSLALAQGDVALAAYEGTGSFAEEGPHASLRAVGSLYPEPVHVMVLAGSTVASVSDLRGRRVAIGEPGSASRTTALRVLAAHGLRPKDIKPLELPFNEALIGLRQKEVDALIQVIGVPADSVRNALTAIPLRLVPLTQRVVAALADAKTGYFAYTIPRGAYAGQAHDVPTVATAALLLASADLSETEVGELTRFVFARERDFAVRGSAQGVMISPANALHGVSVPLHIAALKALENPE